MTRPLENLTKRKATGGRSKPSRGRRAFEGDGYAMEPLVGQTSKRMKKERGASMSTGLVFAEFANVSDHTGKTTKS